MTLCITRIFMTKCFDHWSPPRHHFEPCYVLYRPFVSFFCKNCNFWQEVHRSFDLLEGFGGFVIIKRPLKTINDSKRGHNPNQLKIKMSDSGYPWKTEYEVKYTCTMNLNKVSRRQRLNRQNVLFWYSMSYRLYD